ncbi:DUF4374 domain-containing protein [Sphingobacterium gobiense]|uniref:DUF4374 domain-containing protein n=1 Tax=Sphingobacterium gobiense TaxID=1382456 RepID=A0A2S9JNI3_9SPHI|nr:DUF4374 domain-containing protein [Sphingobacterium gobiense]PRD54668.1 hypothetical protein C5749_14625 [Sphingobacterium gobiense]
MKTQVISKSWMLALTAVAIIGCSKNNPEQPEPNPNPEENMEGQFLVAATVDNSTYLLTAAALDDENASITTIGQGLEYSGTFSNYMQNGYQGFTAINYGRGDAHLGQRFTVSTEGKPERLGAQFEIQNGFITAGIVGDVAYSLMSGGRSSDPTLATINRIPMSAGDPSHKFFKVNEFPGFEGRNAALLGIADAGNGSFYTGLDFPSDNLDDVIIAKINANSLATEAVYSDTRLTVSGGFYKSARYSQIESAADGDVFVFSGNNPGTKKAGALVIRKGGLGFDKDYYWDLEEASGGYRFRRVWHIVEDKFLLEFYNEKIESGTAANIDNAASQFAIVDMSEKKLTWISGMPAKSDIPDLSVSWPYVFAGKLYIGVTTSTEDPRYYVINPETAIAKKGLSVKNASSIDAATFVQYSGIAKK